MQLSTAIILYRQSRQHTRITISFNKLPLEDLHSPQQRLIILRNIPQLIIQSINHTHTLPQLILKGQLIGY